MISAGRYGRRVPAGRRRHAHRCLPTCSPQTFEDIIAAISPVPSRPHGVHPALYRAASTNPATVRYKNAAAGAHSGCHLRLHGVSGAGDADRARSGGLQPTAAADLVRRAMAKKKKDVMAHGARKTSSTALKRRSMCPARCDRGVPAARGRAYLRRNDSLCQLCLQQGARRVLCRGRCADGLAQVLLSGGVHGRA